MDSTELTGRLCMMLSEALTIIKEQAALLAMHGIETADGALEERRETLFQREGESDGR